MAVFTGGKEMVNCSRFCHQGHRLKVSLPPTNVPILLSLELTYGQSLPPLRCRQSQILFCYKPVVQAEMNGILLLPRAQPLACYTVIPFYQAWIWLAVLVVIVQKSGLRCPISYLVVLGFFSCSQHILLQALEHQWSYTVNVGKEKTRALAAWWIGRCGLGRNIGLCPWMSGCRKRPSVMQL